MTGGVISVVTKSGTNAWTGEVLTSIEGHTLEGGGGPRSAGAHRCLAGRVRHVPGRRLHPDRAGRIDRRPESSAIAPGCSPRTNPPSREPNAR